MDQRTCPVCGDTFTPTHHNQKACPPTAEDRARVKGQARSACARRMLNHQYRGRPVITGKVGQPFDCANCGEHCAPGENVAAHATKFCGVNCKKADYRMRLKPDVGPAIRISQRPRSRTFIQGICRECGDPFVQRDNANRSASTCMS